MGSKLGAYIENCHNHNKTKQNKAMRILYVVSLITRFMGPIWGPGVPHVGPVNFAIWDDVGVFMVIVAYLCTVSSIWITSHDDVMARKLFPHFWSFVRGIHRSMMDLPHKGKCELSWLLSKHFEQKVELPVTWDAMTLMFYHCNVGHCVHVLDDVVWVGNMYREQ